MTCSWSARGAAAATELIDGGGDFDTLRYTATAAGTLTLGAGVSVELVTVGDASGATGGVAAINVNAAAATGVAIKGNEGNNALTGGAGANLIEATAATTRSPARGRRRALRWRRQ